MMMKMMVMKMMNMRKMVIKMMMMKMMMKMMMMVVVVVIMVVEVVVVVDRAHWSSESSADFMRKPGMGAYRSDTRFSPGCHRL